MARDPFHESGEAVHGAHERASPTGPARSSLIGDALAQLSAEHRAVVVRAYYLGWTTMEIADDLQIAESTVKYRLHHALRALRLTLQREPSRGTFGTPVR